MDKTADGRFIEKRILLDKKLLRQIIDLAKKRNNLSYPSLSRKLGVSSQMLSHEWLIEGRTLPQSVMVALIKLSGIAEGDVLHAAKILDSFWGQKISNGKLKYKKIKIPQKDTEKFAEFYGIMLGDGCVFSNLKGFSISGDKYLDYYYYHQYLNILIHRLFSISPTLNTLKNERSIKCLVYSTLACRYLKEIGFPIGIKYDGKPTIPKFIFEDKKRLAACIRGMMDTDGSLSAHPHSKAMIHLSITLRSLRDSVKKGLDKLGIIGGVFDKGIMIYGSEKIKLFHDIIGFSNYKNQLKYNLFIKTGKVPSSREVEMFIRAKAGI